MHQRPGKWSGLILLSTLLLWSCSNDGPTRVPPPVTQRPPTASATPTSARPTTDSTKPPRDDLKKGRITRTVRSGGVRVTLEYAIANRIDRWQPGVPQPIMVGMTAASENRAEQRIYLAQVTGDVALSDDAGPLQAPEPLLDQPRITPGYLVTSPATYSQVFLLQPLPDEATTVSIDFRYELLFLESNSTPRDYAKRTITDTIVLTR